MATVGTRSVNRELEEHEERLAALEKGGGGGGIVAVNEPEPGQVLSANEDGEFEWVTPEGSDARYVPRVINLYVNGNGEIETEFTNDEEGVEVLYLGTGLYRIVYSKPFPEPEPGAVSPPFLSVLPTSFTDEVEEEEITVIPVPTVRTNTGETSNGGAVIEMHRMDTGQPVDAHFHFIAIGE